MALFVPICRAIQHAHQKGIIHRDIKPWYRTPLRVAGLFLVLLILAAISSTWRAIRATLAENLASEQRDVAWGKEAEAIRAPEETSKAYEQVANANQKLKVNNLPIFLARIARRGRISNWSRNGYRVSSTTATCADPSWQTADESGK